MAVVDVEQRKAFTQRAIVAGALKRNEWLIEPAALPVGLAILPIAGMARNAVFELVTAPVLCGLIAVRETGRADARAAQQGEAQRVIIGLVRAVLIVGKDGYASGLPPSGEIEPLVRGDLKLALIIVAALDFADIPVVGGFGI